MYDIKLDSGTHDLVIYDYDLQVIESVDRVVQNIKIRLLHIYKEWYLDTTLGVPYFEEILVKDPDIPKIESIIIDTILKTRNVNQLLSFDSFFNNANREYSVTFQVNTQFGDSETISQGLSI